MSRLVPPWVWAAVALAALVGAFFFGYSQGRLKGKVDLLEAQRTWESRERVYQQNEQTAAKNAAEDKRALEEVKAGVAAMERAAVTAVAERDQARSHARTVEARLADLMAAQDAEPLPGTCAEGFTTLAAHIAALNGEVP